MATSAAHERIFATLRADIVSGALPPLGPLRLEEISERFGVSTMPVRSALVRLQTEGLVTHVYHRGAAVAPLSLDDLEEIQAVRAGVEGYAARLGAPRVSGRDLQRMRVLLRHLEAAGGAPDLDLDRFLRNQWALQDTCFRASGRRRLLAVIHEYRGRAERYIRLATGRSGSLSSASELQPRLLAACAAHDGVEAEAAIRSALDWTIERLSPTLGRSGT